MWLSMKLSDLCWDPDLLTARTVLNTCTRYICKYIITCTVCVCICLLVLLLPHTRSEQGKVIGVGVHIYMYIYVCGPKKI